MILIDLAGTVHRAELPATHGAKGASFLVPAGKRLIVRGAGGLRIQRECELFPQFLATEDVRTGSIFSPQKAPSKLMDAEIQSSRRLAVGGIAFE